jgi:spheroidene monooxygenase
MTPTGIQGAMPVARAAAPSATERDVEPSTPQQASSVLRQVGTVAVLVLVNLQRSSRWWGWSRLVLGRWPLRAVPGLGFAKVLGSGAGGGFGVLPSGTHQGLFMVFDDEAAARAFVDSSPVLQHYRDHAQDLCVAVLRACSSKGSWAGAAIAPTVPAPLAGPIAALTRASIRPRHALAFWRLSPPAEDALAAAPGCLLAAGLGEAPLLRQATFSLWSSAAAMDAYARSGAHQQAIRRAYGGGYFSEAMFVRFVPLLVRGVWQGRHHG